VMRGLESGRPRRRRSCQSAMRRCRRGAPPPIPPECHPNPASVVSPSSFDALQASSRIRRRDVWPSEPQGRVPLARRGLQPTFAEDLGDLGLELEGWIVRLDSVGGLRDICVDTGYTHVDHW
jgi:hypothetical protein